MTRQVQFLEAATNGNIAVLVDQLNNFAQALKDWQAKNLETIQEKVKNLNSKTVLSGIKSADQIVTIETAVETLVDTINESKLFKQAFNNHAMTLQLKQQLLDEMIEKLNSTIYSLRDFGTFYEWRNLWATFSDKEVKTIEALIKVRPKNWLAAFEAWYFSGNLA